MVTVNGLKANPSSLLSEADMNDMNWTVDIGSFRRPIAVHSVHPGGTHVVKAVSPEGEKEHAGGRVVPASSCVEHVGTPREVVQWDMSKDLGSRLPGSNDTASK